MPTKRQLLHRLTRFVFQALIEANYFGRIPAHKNWETVPASWEWWHFSYEGTAWGTFLDECELMGSDTSEVNLRGNYWKTDEELDAKPG